jgi:hypothetical protein
VRRDRSATEAAKGSPLVVAAATVTLEGTIATATATLAAESSLGESAAATTATATVATAATAAAATVAATATATTATTEAATGGTGSAGLSFVHNERATLEFLTVQRRDRGVAGILVSHRDETKSARAAGFTIGADENVEHFPIRCEGFAQRVVSCAVIQISDIDLEH